MKISFINAQTISPTGDYIQSPGKEKTGTVLQQAELLEILKACKTLPKAKEKHQNGSIFPYISKTLGKESWTGQDGLTDGVIFIDIDNITKDAAKKIFDSFDEICDNFPCIYAIQYSSSYYLSNTKAGLHIFVSSSILNEEQYKRLAMLALATVARIILNVTGIDLRNPMIDNNAILDSHNTSIMQRFYLYHSDYRVNDSFCEIFTEEIISSESIKKLKKEYSMLNFPTEKTTYISDVKLDVCDSNIKKERICIDRNFSIGKYNGNDIRWRISKIAQILFKDKAQEWCDKYFYYENGKSIYSRQASEKFPSLSVKGWLEDNGYLVSVKKNLIKRGEFIVKYKDLILDFIKNNERAEIIAPTGVGKTTLINGIKNDDLFFCQPEFSLARELNAIVIVPFNVTNKLYDNMIEVSSENCNSVKADEPAVMVWDQALKHWEEIKERTLIIDEAHCLFLDRSYRDTAIKLMNKIKADNCKIVMFTATPSGESEELDCNTLHFNSERNTIQTDFVLVNNIDLAQYNYIKNALKNNWYDRIVLFDDMTAKKIYEKIYVDGEFVNDVAYIRADTKNSKDFKNLRNKELLTKRLTICTCVAFNGLNFKNKNERVLVMTSFNKGQTTSCEIIQEAGRIRNSQVFLKIYVDGKERNNDLVKDIEQAELMNMIASSLSIPEGLLKYNKRLVNSDVQEALKSIQEYLKRKSDINIVVNELKEAGYFFMRVIDKKDDSRGTGNRMNLSYKKKVSDEMIEDIMDGTILDKDYEPDNSSNYKINWKNQIKHMIDNNTYVGVSLETIQDMYRHSNKKTLLSTILDKLYRVIGIALIDDEEWNDYMSKKAEMLSLLKNDIVCVKKIISSYNQNSKLREKYHGKIQLKDNVLDLGLVLSDFIEEVAEAYEEEKTAKSLSKQKKITVTAGFKKLDKYGLKIGQSFDSVTEIAEFCKTSRQNISNWLKKKWLV